MSTAPAWLRMGVHARIGTFKTPALWRRVFISQAPVSPATYCSRA